MNFACGRGGEYEEYESKDCKVLAQGYSLDTAT